MHVPIATYSSFHIRKCVITAACFIFLNHLCFLSAEFHIIVCGLDSIVARRWMNGMVVRSSVQHVYVNISDVVLVESSEV